jgi:hypothetical protein
MAVDELADASEAETASSTPRSRANDTTRETSSASATRRMPAGRRSNPP